MEMHESSKYSLSTRTVQRVAIGLMKTVHILDLHSVKAEKVRYAYAPIPAQQSSSVPDGHQHPTLPVVNGYVLPVVIKSLFHGTGSVPMDVGHLPLLARLSGLELFAGGHAGSGGF